MQLLRQLYAIHSPTGFEWPMIQFVRRYVGKNIPEATSRLDKLGNLYITKGEAGVGYPTLACHLDQVQRLHSDDFEVREEDGTLYGWSEQNQLREGLGADDKNGIWVCLRCLEECPRLKVFMAVGEEKGCIGSNRADMSFFKEHITICKNNDNCRYCNENCFYTFRWLCHCNLFLHCIYKKMEENTCKHASSVLYINPGCDKAHRNC